MASLNLIFASAYLIATFQEIYGHGYLWEPVSRSTAYKRGHGTPENYNHNQVWCGGREFQIKQGGKCGVCGDQYTSPQPRPNENGGKYGTGKIVQVYNQGQRATIEVFLSANHMGNFEFAVCPLNGPKDIETEECFKKYPLRLSDGGYKYEIIDDKQKTFHIDVILPPGLTCKHCSFRWHYETGNHWGVCKNSKHGEGRKGCGAQEHFVNCADIAIL